MQIDQAQTKKVKADGILEKPFDTQTLRSLIEKFVSKTNSFPLKGLLQHPPLPDFAESDTFVRQKNDSASYLEKNSIPEFKKDEPPKIATPSEPADEWSASSAEQFVVETESFGDFEEVIVVNSKAAALSSPDMQKRITEQVNTYLQHSPLAQSKMVDKSAFSNKTTSHFDEQILREEIKQMAERICWQIIPDITEKVVRDELNKLLQGLEKNT